jgi:hypothetical protein
VARVRGCLCSSHCSGDVHSAPELCNKQVVFIVTGFTVFEQALTKGTEQRRGNVVRTACVPAYGPYAALPAGGRRGAQRASRLTDPPHSVRPGLSIRFGRRLGARSTVLAACQQLTIMVGYRDWTVQFTLRRKPTRQAAELYRSTDNICLSKHLVAGV